jgi:uncharacterized protein with HEPN domain
MNGKIGDKQRLSHILDAISEIEAYTTNVELKDFLENSMMKYASIKQIEIIGEAANSITPMTKELFPEIEWKRIIGMRHILVHEYFGIAPNLVWQVIINDIPALRVAVNKIFPLVE